MSHLLKRQKLGLFARMGGSFNRGYFVLEIDGDELDPAEVSAILKTSPTKSYRKGDETPRGAQYRRTGGWFIDSGEQPLSDNESGEALFEKWVSSLPTDKEAWAELKQRFSVRIRLAAYTDQMNAKFIVSPAAAQALASRGIPFLIDPYLEMDDDEASR